VTGRKATGDGPMQSIANKITAGSTYTVSAKVKYTTGPATHQFNVTITDGSHYYIMGSATVTKGAWTTISGSYVIPTSSNLDVTKAKVFVETVWTGTPDATNDLMNFWADDISMTGATVTPPTHPKGTAAPAKTVGNSNPLMDYQYGADPFAMVYDGTVYEYMTGDGQYIDASGNVVQDYEYDGSGNIKDNSYSKIQTIDVISSKDMVNWTNNGAIKVAGPNGAAKWAANSWAPAATHKTINGKEEFFLYFANSAGGIGVLQSESPVGPWRDPIGKPLVSGSTPGTSGVVWMFDPAALVDSDGTGYLYFGGGVPSTNGTSTSAQTDHPQSSRVIQLGPDMISTVGSAQMIDAPAMFEDSGINKVGDTYYYSYCTNFSHSATIDGKAIPTGTIAYMTSSSPMGPFTYQGTFLANPGSFFGAGGNNHHAMFELNDQWYVTYHAQTVQTALVKGGSLDKEHGYRSTNIDKVKINADGSLAQVTGTYAGVSQTSSVDPYQTIQAETIGWDSGIQDAYDPSSGVRVQAIGTDNSQGEKLTNVNNGEWTGLGGVDFGSEGMSGAVGFTAHVLAKAGGTVGIYVDSPDTIKSGDLIGTVTIPGSSAGAWTDVSTTFSQKVTGKHSVFFVYSGSSTDGLFDVDYGKFTPAAPVAQTITFETLQDRTFGDADFTVSATADSGLPVSFTAAGVCTVTDAQVHLTGAGSCSVTASQGGNNAYLAATPVTQQFSVAKASQTIAFSALADHSFSDADFGVGATADSGLPVSFTAAGVCTITGTQVHLTGIGSCAITAQQEGNGDYEAASPVTQSFNVVDTTPPTITETSVADGATYTLGAEPAPTCTATDVGTGLAGPCVVTVTGGTPNGVGTFQYTATATDLAGNTATSTGSYRVIYRWDGFTQPINDTAYNAGSALSVFKAGSTVPAKFQLKKADGTVVQASTAPIWLTPQRGSAISAAVDENVSSDPAASGSTYRWDATAGQYMYNWSTKGLAGGYHYVVGVTLDDGQTYYVDLGLK